MGKNMKNYLYIICLAIPLHTQTMQKQKKKDPKPSLPIPEIVDLRPASERADDAKEDKKEKKRGFKLPKLFGDKSSSSSSSSSTSSIIGKISLLSKISRNSKGSGDTGSLELSPDTPRSRPATPTRNVHFSTTQLETVYELGATDPDERELCVSPEKALEAATRRTREQAKKNDAAQQDAYHIGWDDDDDAELKRIAAQAAEAERSICGVPADETDLANLIALVSSAKISSPTKRPESNTKDDDGGEYYD